MIEFSRFWDVGDFYVSRPPNLGKASTARFLQALIKCHGKLHSYICFGSNELPDSSRDIVYRISLPINSEKEFERLSGYQLSEPPKVSGQ
jgi:hypothetical protein